MIDRDYDSAVAIIGMSGRFPGAGGVDELWTNLVDGRAGLRPVTEGELTTAGVSPAELANPNYVRWAAPLDGIDQFDASMFGFSRREAESMDPQHRIFLECAWESLESAGYPPTSMSDKVGVFAGCGFPDYLLHVRDRLENEPGGQLLLAVGNERDSLSSMVSYKLDLRGPSITVQTFCSTSLVAVHLAVQSLLNFESDVALAGGAYVDLPQPAGYRFEEGGITTPDGRVRSFDAGANGTILGNGVAVVTLKRMTEALADGDPIHAVILGSATNNDGRACAGYTAPGVDGQSEVIELALGVADVKPETIGYVECHATGTQLGDSIELTALGRVFQRPPAQPTVLGALKPSIGHLDRASGVTGLIRASLALRNQVLPGTANFETPNPTLAAARDRFVVLPKDQPWPAGDHPRRAGVSSFGFGGTNAHVVLEEAPVREPRPAQPGPHLLVLSARDLTALYEAVERLGRHLESHREAELADVAYTLQQSRTSFSMRWAVVCDDYDDAELALADPGRWIIGESDLADAPIALTIPDPASAPESWWQELREAARQLGTPGGSRAAVAQDDDPVAESATGALIEALLRLRVRLVQVAGSTAGGTLSAAPAGVAPVEVTLDPAGDQTATQWLLAAVARLWQVGAVVDWATLHDQPRRVPLPTYPFQRARYWVDAAPATGRPAQASGKASDPARWTYLPSWRRQSVAGPDLADRLRAAGPWLVLAAEAGGEALVGHLREIGADLTVVRPGTGFTRTETGDFTVRPDHREDYAQVLGALLLTPRTLVHGFSLAAPDGARGPDDPIGHFDDAQVHGSASVLALASALDDLRGQPVELVLLTDGTVGVSGADLRHPEHATLGGLAPVLAQENPDLRCRHVDVDVDVQTQRHRASLDQLARQVLTEAVTTHAGPVAWRTGRRWLRAYEAQPLAAPLSDAETTTAESTVLITGGLGSVGLILARHLAGNRNCRLVLTTRSPIPPPDQWQAYLRTADPATDRTARYVARALELEERGAEVLAMSADVADPEAMAAVVRAARERFGGIDVVIHGAGVQHSDFFGPAHAVDWSVSQAHYAAKVHGFHVLERVLAGEQVRRRITLSSLSTVLGGISLGPYAAANAALDAYAQAARDVGGGDWLTVDWDAWRTGGDHGATSVFEMSPEEGVDVFERAVAAGDDVSQLVISTGALADRLHQWVIRPSAADAPVDDAGSGQRDPRPALGIAYVAPAEGLETTLADIWAAVLRLERVGVDDDFYRLGGDSIVAIELIARIRKELQLAVPVTALLEDATVRLLARRLAAAGGGG
ncbi:SDR family NAD(P)-dependent oxidoreductase [Plantactinospora sp. S1510]|uniref:SDR family NAD(P)-dependent oxidoreductase n=1 Tax=Plantactinospora alkalitolerans TaxID=2789879 RepID=A0ABS0H2Y2_9ACTN|nr:SDR family NAD(P)-dependent oxidoreductase [Plantactinospora alkalitolerans]MBF9132823.1 SDR family NAD(P)-dependent oxidoreductase [Plantactinospora alkalitolerans]